jgi:CubicO group peptidase (beta-lactamase class C family)
MQEKYDKQSLKSLMKEAHIPGGSFANIDVEGRVETLQIGTIAKDSTTKVKEESPLPCASLSKPVFAYLVLKLIDANKKNSAEPGLGKFKTDFDLETPLYTLFRDKDGQVMSDAENPFLKKFHSDHQENAKKITGKMVLSHTTGLHIMGAEPYQFQFDPGTKYAYSGIGIECLEETIKELTGTDIEMLAKRYVFEPLNMIHSTYGPKPVAANSLITTAEEYAHFIREWINDDTLNYAFNPVPPADSMENDFFPQSEDNPVDAIEVTAEDRKRVAWGMGIGLVKNEQGEVIAAFGTGDMNQARAGFGATINPQTKQCTEVSTYLANSHNGHMLAGEVLPKTCEPALNNFRIYGFAQNVEQLDGTDFHGLNPKILKPKFQEIAYQTKISLTLSCKEELKKIKATDPHYMSPTESSKAKEREKYSPLSTTPKPWKY